MIYVKVAKKNPLRGKYFNKLQMSDVRWKCLYLAPSFKPVQQGPMFQEKKENQNLLYSLTKCCCKVFHKEYGNPSTYKAIIWKWEKKEV